MQDISLVFAALDSRGWLDIHFATDDAKELKTSRNPHQFLPPNQSFLMLHSSRLQEICRQNFVVLLLFISTCLCFDNTCCAQTTKADFQKLKQDATQARRKANLKKQQFEKVRILLRNAYRTKKGLEAQRIPAQKELEKQFEEFQKNKSKLPNLNQSKTAKDKTVKSIAMRLKNIQARVNRLQSQLESRQTSSKKNAKKKKKPAKTARQLNAELKKTTPQLKRVQTQLSKAKVEPAVLNRQIVKLIGDTATQKKRIQELRTIIEQIPDAIVTSSKTIETNRPQFDRLKKEFSSSENAAVQKEKEYEQAWLSSGRGVSFAQQIAPILYRRCFACHNSKAAKGQYNMETFATVLKGGESGEAIEHGDAENSMLFAMIDDGSMPQDSDPLTKKEIGLIKKWIDVGGRLDVGISPEAALIEIVPPLLHPKSPKTYRAGIPVTALAYSPDGKYLASSGYHEVLIWESTSGKLVRRIGNLAERIYDIAFDNGGERIAVAAGTPGVWGEVKLFRAIDGSFIRRVVVSNAAVLTVAFNPDQNKIASAGADHTIRVHDISDGKLLATIKDHTDWVTDLAWSPDGMKLASVSRDKSVKIWDVQKRKISIEDELQDKPNPNVFADDLLLTLSGHTQPVNAVVFSGDGKLLASAGADRIVRVWNSQTGKPIRQIRGIGAEIHQLHLTPDGKLISSSSDRSVRIHQLSNGKLLQTLRGHTDWVTAVTISPVTNMVASGAFNGQIRIWSAKTAKSQKQFQAIPK